MCLLAVAGAPEEKAEVREHLLCALQLARSSAAITPHRLEHPLMHAVEVNPAKDSGQLLSTVRDVLKKPEFAGYSDIEQ